MWYDWNMSKEEILREINQQMPYLREKYHVKKLGLFGSFAQGNQSEKSDVDILVEFESPVGFFDFIRMENFLSGILKKKVDLISQKALKASIKNEVLREIINLC